MNALLDKLKDFFSKSFVLSSFLPVLVCAAVNAALLYRVSPAFRELVRAQQPAANIAGVLQGTSVVFVLAVIAGLISPSITFFREVLEGEHWLAPFLPLRTRMIGAHTENLRRCEERIRRMAYERTLLDGERIPRWQQYLRGRAAAGKAANGTYSVPPGGALDEVFEAQLRNEVLTMLRLSAAKHALGRELSAADKDKYPQLRDRHHRFLEILDEYAKQRLDHEIIEKTAERQREWGQTDVAPTRLGNLARATSAYGLLLYRFSLDSGWSRLLTVLQKNKEQLAVLQDVKAGLDAVITLFWLLAPTTLLWSLYLLTQYSAGLFVLVALGGAVACNLLYRTAISSYIAFADLVRGTVDLYRLDLFPALHLPMPGGLVEERALWDRIRKQTEFGEVPDLRYQHPKA